MTIKLGRNAYMDDETYHEDREFISSSGLKLMSPEANKYDPKKFYRTYVENIKEDKLEAPALTFGKYVHSLILEPDTVEASYAIYEGKSRRGAQWDKFAEENKHKTIITSSQASMAQQLIDKFSEKEVIIGTHNYEQPVLLSSFFKKGEAEVTLGAEIDGIKVKVRCDYHREFSDFASIQDVKTTKDVVNTRRQAEKVCDSLDYDLSAALYVDVAEKVTGKKHDFYFCFLSKADGETSMFRASKEFLEKGRKKYKAAIEELRRARETGIYFNNEIQELGVIE